MRLAAQLLRCYTPAAGIIYGVWIRVRSGCASQREGFVSIVKLDRATVEHIAALARVGLTTDEIERMRDQLSAVLDHISMLEEVDTSNIPPTAQVIELRNVMRDDVVEPSLPLELVLRNAPRSEDGYIRVNAVLDQS
jgi:aspartyl-tRNA(Asn)/glutamyl-tRNA(Gln) amidotransferase subunit C